MEMDLAPLHPIVVHFAIAFLIAGVLFRVAAVLGKLFLNGRLAFASPSAAVLLLAGALAAYGAVESGEAASGNAEAIPGAHDVVEEHEDWAEWTFRIFVVVAFLELLALGLARIGKDKPVLIASAALGLVGLYFVYETGEHGGQVVYSYAGGVGTRTGDDADVGRLLLAGLYQQFYVDRREDRLDDGLRLLEEAARRWPGQLDIQLLMAQTHLEDKQDAAAALKILGTLQVPAADRERRLRHGLLLVDALIAVGQKDGARAALSTLKAEHPDDLQVKEREKKLAS
jgi:uncharacterized membrane protein